jgi:hypothetical protein
MMGIVVRHGTSFILMVECKVYVIYVLGVIQDCFVLRF